VKQLAPPNHPLARLSFSILERIDVGETLGDWDAEWLYHYPFSILERIDVGETRLAVGACCHDAPFSILERIDVGETNARGLRGDI